MKLPWRSTRQLRTSTPGGWLVGSTHLCTVNVNSREEMCTSSSAHWQQASKLPALRSFEPIWNKDGINVTINLIYLSPSLLLLLLMSLLMWINAFLSWTGWRWYQQQRNETMKIEPPVSILCPLVCLLKHLFLFFFFWLLGNNHHDWSCITKTIIKIVN